MFDYCCLLELKKIIYDYMSTHMCMYVCIYTYIYREREEKERERLLVSHIQCPLPQLTDPKVLQYCNILNLNWTLCGLY